MTECRGFHWIGQPLSSCDECGRPAHEHDGWAIPPDDSPFSTVGRRHWPVRPFKRVPPPT